MTENHNEISDSKCRIVVAIDFGTTFTGFAFSFRESEETIYFSDHGNALSNARVPTAILLTDKDNSLVSFGTSAEEDFRDSFDLKTSKSYRFFNRFKMELFKADKLSRDKTLTDTQGDSIKAIEVFKIILKHLKHLIVDSIRISVKTDSSLKDIPEGEILWVLTIPAIWSDSARQFMREAAIDAGYPKDRLRLVLGPEAASMCCREMRLNLSAHGFTPLLAGNKYIIADLGGGTVDICVHEVLADGKIRELYRATGGDFGGTAVDREFQNFIIAHVGENVWREFTQNHFDENLKMMRSFEERKKRFESNSKEVLIELGESLIKPFEMSYKNSSCKEEIKIMNGKCLCSRKQMERFFSPSVDGIISLISEVLSKCKDDNINALLLVGGFSDSHYLRSVINKQFEKTIKTVLVKSPSLAVLKGAVMMGYHPSSFIERRARFTYGFAVATPFKQGVHPENLKFERDGKFLCSHIFDKVIQKDQILEYGKSFRVTVNACLNSPEAKKQNFALAIYKSTSKDPDYCVEDDSTGIVGTINIEAPERGWPDNVAFEYSLIVGETELQIKVTDTQSDRVLTASFDFL